MLKIRKLVEGESVVLALSGRIEDENLPHLESLISMEAQSIVLDLKDVRLAGQEAIRFLVRCKQGGAKLINCPAYVSDWITAEQGAQ
jgi:hypothetical protein